MNYIFLSRPLLARFHLGRDNAAQSNALRCLDLNTKRVRTQRDRFGSLTGTKDLIQHGALKLGNVYLSATLRIKPYLRTRPAIALSVDRLIQTRTLHWWHVHDRTLDLERPELGRAAGDVETRREARHGQTRFL